MQYKTVYIAMIGIPVVTLVNLFYLYKGTLFAPQPVRLNCIAGLY